VIRIANGGFKIEGDKTYTIVGTAMATATTPTAPTAPAPATATSTTQKPKSEEQNNFIKYENGGLLQRFSV
jgi:hypothetical protein